MANAQKLILSPITLYRIGKSFGHAGLDTIPLTTNVEVLPLVTGYGVPPAVQLIVWTDTGKDLLAIIDPIGRPGDY